MLDLSKQLTIVPQGRNEPAIIVPFIRLPDPRARAVTGCKTCVARLTLWLEYTIMGEPDRMLLDMQPAIPKEQTLQTYQQLNTIEVVLDGKIYHAYQAVCRRIEGGEIGIVRLGEGCLWTALPKI